MNIYKYIKEDKGGTDEIEIPASNKEAAYHKLDKLVRKPYKWHLSEINSKPVIVNTGQTLVTN